MLWGGSAGYECTEETTLLTDESVTTVAEYGFNNGTLAYSVPIDADTIKVTFNGTEYICNKNTTSDDYGAPFNDSTQSYDWSEYPFNLFGDEEESENRLTTETAGTYQIKVERLDVTVTTSECFRNAVNSVLPTPSFLGVRGLYASGFYDRFNYSVREIFDVIKNGGSASVAIMNSAYSGTRTVYQLHRIESDDTDVVNMGDLGDITKVYFVAHDGSQISASIVNGEDKWSSESNA